MLVLLETILAAVPCQSPFTRAIFVAQLNVIFAAMRACETAMISY